MRRSVHVCSGRVSADEIDGSVRFVSLNLEVFNGSVRFGSWNFEIFNGSVRFGSWGFEIFNGSVRFGSWILKYSAVRFVSVFNLIFI